MGKISERIHYARINEGFCQICGNFERLTKDHVPPKSVVPPTIVEQKLVIDYMENKSIKGVKANYGSVFKTLCKACNNNLSDFDLEIKNVTQSLNEKIKKHLNHPSMPYNIISESIDAKKYARGIIGHMLAAVPNIACKEKFPDAPFVAPLRQFVLGEIDSYEDTHDLHYWFYPHKMNVSGLNFAICDLSIEKEKNTSAGGCLYFYPIAFLITEKNKAFSEISPTSRKLELKDRKIYLSVTAEHIGSALFPFFNINHSLVVMHKAFVTVSHQKL